LNYELQKQILAIIWIVDKQNSLNLHEIDYNPDFQPEHTQSTIGTVSTGLAEKARPAIFLVLDSFL
jgi:hypothetical protein